MRKKFFIIFLLLFFICSPGIRVYSQNEVNMKKVVMIVAEKNFRDEELFQPKEILERADIAVRVACSSLNMATGTLGATIKPQVLISDIKAADYDAIVFIGGAGSSQYWDDPVAHKLAREAFNTNKIIAGICIAPVTLAKAGILKGKRATVWSTEASQLKAAGAIYTGKDVERDGNIITAAGPFAASEFGEELLNALLY